MGRYAAILARHTGEAPAAKAPAPAEERQASTPAAKAPPRAQSRLERRLHSASVSVREPSWEDEQADAGAQTLAGATRVIDLRRDAMRARLLRNKAARERLEQEADAHAAAAARK